MFAVFPAAAVGLGAPGLDAVVGLAVLDAAVPYQTEIIIFEMELLYNCHNDMQPILVQNVP